VTEGLPASILCMVTRETPAASAQATTVTPRAFRRSRSRAPRRWRSACCSGLVYGLGAGMFLILAIRTSKSTMRNGLPDRRRCSLTLTATRAMPPGSRRVDERSNPGEGTGIRNDIAPHPRRRPCSVRRRGTTSVRMPDSPAGGRGSELRFETYSRCVWVGVTSLIDEIKGESPREHAPFTALPLRVTSPPWATCRSVTAVAAGCLRLVGLTAYRTVVPQGPRGWPLATSRLGPGSDGLVFATGCTEPGQCGITVRRFH
jgi:hypothetical protein